MTDVAPDMASRTKASSVIEPTWSVNAETLMSMPRTERPSERSRRTMASPRCPALPVTRTLIGSRSLPDQVIGDDELLVIIVIVVGRQRRVVLAAVIGDDHVRDAHVDLVRCRTRDEFVALVELRDGQDAGGKLAAQRLADEQAGDLLAVGEAIRDVAVALDPRRLDDLTH